MNNLSISIVFVGSVLATSGSYAATNYEISSLVTDDQTALAAAGFGPASFVDPHLINPWGMSHSSTSPFWVSNQGSGNSTLYNGAGTPLPLVVTTPQAGPPAGPTGQVFNGSSGFGLSDGNPGLFFFANLDGSISGWNPAAGTTAQVVVAASNASRPAAYTGLAIANSGGASFLYAANRRTGKIDVFDQSFSIATLAGNFTDPGANPDGLVPFNVHALDGHVYVSYSVAGPDADEAPLGSGFVSEFNADGTFVKRVAQGSQVASPWGLALAPHDFGEFSGALLVGNFSEDFGFINAFDPNTGTYLGTLHNQHGDALNIAYMWTLLFGNGGAGGDADDLYFTAGIGDEAHGLLGEIGVGAAPVPVPASLPLLLTAILSCSGWLSRKRLSPRLKST